MTDEQYLALSQLAYQDFSQYIGQSGPLNLGTLLRQNKIEGYEVNQQTGETVKAIPSLTALTDLASWNIIAYKTAPDGFGVIALKNPDTGEVVFSFRGTSSFNPFTPGNDLGTDARIALAVPTVDQYDNAEDFVFQTLNRYGSVCYDTREDMFAALSNNSSGISFAGHSLGGGLAQYMTYKTSDIQNGDTGVKSVTFNAVGIGQTLYNPVALLNQGSYNSTDHVNSNDIVGNYGIQLGTTVRHIDNSDVDYSKVDFSTISSLLYTRLQLLSGAITTTQASSQINSLLSKLATNPDVYTFEDTMRVYAGYNSAGGEGSTSPISNLHDYHGLDTLIDENDHTNMTQTTTSQAGILQYQQIFQLMNAIHIIEVAKKEGNYNAALSSNIMPIGHYYNTLDGVTYFSPNGQLTPGTLGQYTYTNDAIAYANYVIHRSEQALHNGSLASPYEDFQRAIASNVRRVDPLVLDLSGDGIKTTSVGNSNAYFDLDQNGFAEKTSWVDTDDGLLVLDKNNDGIINDSNELFGDQTLLSDGVTHASSGFTALAEYDENHDGIIDENDSIYSLLRVWQDLNGDGISSTNELKNLLDLGIISIGLGYLNTGITDDGNNIQVRAGEFTRVDGSTGAIGEYLFNRDTADTMDEAPITVSPDIATLPNIPGAGNVASLWKAMYNDTSGVLKTLVGDFIAEDDASARYDILQQILLTWTGSDSIDPASRGGIFDGQKLAVMEKFFGVNFNGNPGPNSITSLVSSYNKLADNMYVALMSETRLKPVLDLLHIDALGNLSFSDVQSEIDTELLTNETTALDDLSELSRIIKFYGEAGASGFVDFRNHYATQSDVDARAIDFTGNRTQVGSTGDDSLSTSGDILALDGGDGNDYLYANTTSDIVLYGGTGDDHLYGSAGSDTLYSGTGNDVLEGGIGNDTYMFRRGDGVDTIYDSDANEGNIDSIVFANNITPEDVQAIRSGDNLELRVIGTDDKIIVERYFSAYARTSGWYSIYVGENGNKIEEIKFANGVVWDIAAVKEKVRYISGTEGNDSISGYNDQKNIIDAGDGNDVIFAGTQGDQISGGVGDDSIYGSSGNDILDGSTGNDILEGGAGNDTYIFGRGYGVDKIYDSDTTEGNSDTVTFLEGVNPDDIFVRRNGDDLELSIIGTNDKLTVERYFSAYARTSGWYSIYVGENGNKIEQFTFANGTVWSIADIKEKARVTLGTDNSETISGFNDQDDIINAYAGDDTIYAGDGNDFINGGDGNDVVFAGNGHDTLIGGSGNDQLFGENGDDLLDGGAGDDILEGGAGNDTYVFGLGYGVDKIYDSDAAQGNQDTVQFLAGISPNDVIVRRSGDDLVLSISNTDDKLVVEKYFSAYARTSGWYSIYVGEDGNKIEQFTFADGTIWGIADIKERARTIVGTDDSEFIQGYNDQKNITFGKAGDDTIYAGSLGDQMSGGVGGDALYGSIGNDTLDGGTGNDTLEGGAGNDTYIFGLGYGADKIYDSDTTEGNQDTIQFLAGVMPEDIRVRRNGDDLELNIAGTADTLVVERYFSAYGRSSGYYTNYVGENGNKIEQITFADGTIWGISDIKEKARVVQGTNDSEVVYGYNDQDDIVSAYDGDDTIYTYAGNDAIDAGAGNDIVYASDGNDTLIGGAGDDALYGEAGNDMLDGGIGNDILEGGIGNDTYRFGLGYGIDTIYDSDSTEGNQDTIQFLADITPEDIRAVRIGDDLELRVIGTDDKLIVEKYFSAYGRSSGYYANNVGPDGNKIETIKFDDGTIWSIADIKEKVRVIEGTADSDYIYGYSDQKNIISGRAGDDTIYAGVLGDQISGGDGDDTLYGSSSNDALDGGAGNDTLEGGAGNDTYVFGLGYGNDKIYDSDAAEGNVDTIQFLAGTSPEDIQVKRNGDNLELHIANTNDTLTVERYFSLYGRSSGYYTNYVGENGNKIEQIAFADGTIWDIADIRAKARFISGSDGDDYIAGYNDQKNIINTGVGDDTIYAGSLGDEIHAGAGNDTIYGSASDDLLDGGTGNDKLEGGAGNDTYIFGRGYGHDVIYDSDATQDNLDRVLFSNDISPDDAKVTRSGDDLIITINGTDDTFTVERYFSVYGRSSGYYVNNVGPDGNKIEQFVFADGTVWDIATIKDKARYINGTSGDDTISGHSGQDNIIDAGAGNDTIYVSDGKNQIFGGAGNDKLYGGSGDDTLDGGAGDDILEGGIGNDTYLFGLGYGTDTIYDNDATVGNIDTLEFLAGISPEDVFVQRVGGDLSLSILNTSDKVVIQNYFSPSTKYGYYSGIDSNAIEKITFTDGTIWDEATIKEKSRTLYGTQGDDNLYSFGDLQYILYGGDGNDSLYAAYLGDELHGDAGDDALYGSGGDDILDGGTGNDRLEGSYGNDTYLFKRGYGQDVIYDNDPTAGNVDKVILGDDINPENIQVRRINGDLELSIADTTDKLLIQNYFVSYNKSGYYVGVNSNVIEEIHFANGTVWGLEDIKEKARVVIGTDGSDNIYGFSDQQNIISGLDGDDTIYAGGLGDQISGGAGHDSLYGSVGNDTLGGGAGNDYLEGGYGNDTYVFGLGYGTDTIYDNDSTSGNTDVIEFLAGIAPSDVTAVRDNGNLELRINNTTDKLIVQNYFVPYTKYGYYSSQGANEIEEIHFSDGTIWSVADVKEMARTVTGTNANDNIYGFNDQKNIISGFDGNDTIYAGVLGDYIDGGSGNDTIYGSSGDDYIIGGAGDDILEGSTGNDTYVFNAGFGADTIYDNDNASHDSHDAVEFGVGIASEDVMVRRLSSNDLELTILGTNDKLTIQSFFSPYYRNSSWYTGTDSNAIEEFRFADGTIWAIADIKEKARYITGTDNDEVLQGFSDQRNIISGNAGNDTIYASYQGDELYGGTGNDNLYGSSGNDILDGGTGDDYLEGSTGNDTYVFGLGYGQDMIYDNDSSQGGSLDVVTFLAGINPADVSIKRTANNDLELTFAGSDDKLTVQQYFSPYYRNSSWYTGTNSNAIEEFRFADGTVWDIATIKEKARYINGADGNDTLQGFGDQQNIIVAGDGDDIIYAASLGDQMSGGAGNDMLYGASGNDTLDGSTGDDTLQGGTGDDTYIFAPGYGQDTIYDNNSGQTGDLDKVIFGAGIAPSDITAARMQNGDLELTFTGLTDKLTIQRYFSPYYKDSSWYTGTNSNAIEEFHFADNTVWDIATIRSMVTNIRGTNNADTLYGYEDNDIVHAGSGDDVLYASSGNDVLYGEVGNDYLYGDAGDDTYVFSGEFGVDHIVDYQGNDLVTIDQNQDSLIFQQSGGNLQMLVAGSSNSVTVDYWYQNNDYKVETFKASDGSTISSTQIEQLIQAMASFSTDNGGMSWSDALQQKPQDVQSIISQYWTAPTV